MSSRCLVRGSINIDEYFHVKDIVRPGETISSTNLDKRPGGKGANQSVALARAGSYVDLVGAVGTDGEWVLSTLKSTGVNVEKTVVLNDIPTGRALIQLTERGQNSIILFKGANYTRLHDNISIHPGTTHLLLQNEIDLSDTLAWLSAASSRGISTILNPSPMLTNAELKDFPWSQLTWLLVNEGEARDLYQVLSGSTAVPMLDSTGPNETYTRLEAYLVVKALSPLISGTSIVCTLGADGVLASLPWLEEFIYLPAVECDVRDTTGAGDCFTGYLVSGLMRTGKKDVELTREEMTEILQICVQASGMCVEKRGTLESIPRREEVHKRFS